MVIVRKNVTTAATDFRVETRLGQQGTKDRQKAELRALEIIYSLQNQQQPWRCNPGKPALQNLGTVILSKGRLAVYPNVM